MNKNDKVYVAGHRGMVGSAIMRELQKRGFSNLVTKTSTELDLRNQQAVNHFFEKEKPHYVFIAAAKVGGIIANETYPMDFLCDNMQIQLNVMRAAHLNNIKKLMFLGSSCIYPKMATQPIVEEALLTGLLEPTNEPYAIAKIAGIKMCDAYRSQHGCNFISVMPSNLYGYNDNYHPQNSHVMPALIRRLHEATVSNLPVVTIWGSGSPLREFLFADDLAQACYFLMQNFDEKGFINVGSGKEISIKELALLIKKIVGYKGELRFDLTKPDGTPRKRMDVSKLTQRGWSYSTELEDGVKLTYQDYLAKLCRQVTDSESLT